MSRWHKQKWEPKHNWGQGPSGWRQGPPGWGQGPSGWGQGPPDWEKWRPQRRRLFFRFASIFGLIALLIVGGMGVVAFLLTRLFGGAGHTAVFVWVAGCGLSVALPMLAMTLAVRAFRRITTPLATVMAAADSVAGGDFSVRVTGPEQGEFGRLLQSFNRMVEELERSDQQRRNLTADVAHELRNPLHIIQGNLEGVLDGVYEPTSAHIEATLDETRMLARLVEDLRTLSLAEGGQLPLYHEAVDIVELIEDVETSFSGPAETAVVTLQTMVPNGDSGLRVWGDADRLNQVLSNLVANALRHTAPNGTIMIKAMATPESVALTVADSGEGIAKADLPFIFDRFWRGDRARSHHDGTGGGLGLAIVKQLVQAHEGRIDVDSQLGQGTTFVIQLPRYDSGK